MKEDYKLLKEYNNRLLDKNFLKKAFEIYLKEDPDLIEYAYNLKITDNEESDNNLGNYRIDDKLVTVYLNNILRKDKLSINNKNILGLEILKHELIHAKNIKKINMNKDDIKTCILKMSLLEYCIENGLYKPTKDLNLLYIRFLTDLNYRIDPGERNVEIEAWKYIVNLLKNQKTTDELLVARTNLYYSYIRGYKDNGVYLNCPTYEFLLELRLMRDYKEIKNRVESRNYNFNTRLTYGLPITYEEYNNEILKKVKLKKRKLNK